MRSLFLQRSWRWALFVAAEGLLYLSYQHHDARFHWFLHFFVGTSAALLAMAVLMYWSARPLRFPLLWLFTGHIIAMLPDILMSYSWCASPCTSMLAERRRYECKGFHLMRLEIYRPIPQSDDSNCIDNLAANRHDIP